MTTSDAQTFRDLMLRLDTVFDKASSQARTNLYFEELRDISVDLLRQAVALHMKRARTYPRPAELRVLAYEAQDATTKALPPADIEGEPTYFCVTCLDSGWAPVDGSRMDEWRDPTTGSAMTVRKCACRRTSPKFQQKRVRLYGNRDSDVYRPW